MVLMLLAGWLALAPQTTPPAVRTDYRVGPADVLQVNVFGEEQLSRASTVDNDGTIDVALVGRLKVAGMTPRDIETLIASKLRDGFLRNPQVSIEIREYRSQNIFVTGEVRTPGTVSLKGNTSLMEALAMAGSLTPNAGTEIVIVHPKGAAAQPTMPTAEGATVTKVDLRDLQEGRAAPVALRDGDTIVVPRAAKFFVTGYVRSPGGFVAEPGLTVLQAISLAGGITERGSNRGIRIRRTVNGRMQEIKVSESDVVLPGDTIVVKQRIF
jgi:polysaccharide export outer membrane protein